MKKFKLVVYNKGSDSEVKALYDENTLIMSGDYYHDKIDQRIESFLQGIKYAGIEYIILEKKEKE